MEESFFLCYGKGPFNSPEEVMRLPTRVRGWYVERLSDQYKEEERQARNAADSASISARTRSIPRRSGHHARSSIPR